MRVNAQYVIITRAKMPSGIDVKRSVVPGPELPWRITKRENVAQSLGEAMARALSSNRGDITAFGITDGKRVLRSWRRMTYSSEFTGTHDHHPMI